MIARSRSERLGKHTRISTWKLSARTSFVYEVHRATGLRGLAMARSRAPRGFRPPLLTIGRRLPLAPCFGCVCCLLFLPSHTITGSATPTQTLRRLYSSSVSSREARSVPHRPERCWAYTLVSFVAWALDVVERFTQPIRTQSPKPTRDRSPASLG